ncbi:MAK10-like protein [Tanacetum coccineum]
MGDANPIRTLGDYSTPSHEGYKNPIELPKGKNVVPLRSDTIRNWLERLPVGSISTWEDLTTRFLAQFFPPGMTTKFCNDILMFQQHQGESLSEAWTCFKDLLQKFSHHGIELWLQVQIFYDHVYPATRRTTNQSAGVGTNQGILQSISDRRLIKLEHQVQCLMEAYIAHLQPTQVNKITSSCEMCSGPRDAQYCMENPQQTFVDYVSSRTDQIGSTQFAMNQGPRSFNEAANA